jgi:hypothetical protein
VSKDNHELDDLARLHAFEHIVGSLAAMWSVNYAQANGGLPSGAVSFLKDALLSSLNDSKERPPEFNSLMKLHIERVMKHVESMAKYADQGFKS